MTTIPIQVTTEITHSMGFQSSLWWNNGNNCFPTKVTTISLSCRWLEKWESKVVTTIGFSTLQKSKLLWWKQYICILCYQSQIMEWVLTWKFVLLNVIYVRNVYHWKKLKICWHGTKWYHACPRWSKFIEERPENDRAISIILSSVLCKNYQS